MTPADLLEDVRAITHGERVTAYGVDRNGDDWELTATAHVTPVREGGTTRFVTDEPATLEEIAQVHGLTRERVRQIELKLLMSLSCDQVILDLARQWGLRPQPKSPAAKRAADATSPKRGAHVAATAS